MNKQKNINAAEKSYLLKINLILLLHVFSRNFKVFIELLIDYTPEKRRLVLSIGKALLRIVKDL